MTLFVHARTRYEAHIIMWQLANLLMKRDRMSLDDWLHFKYLVMLADTQYGLWLQALDQGCELQVVIAEGELP